MRDSIRLRYNIHMVNKNPQVSIIIPVYNVESYLDECMSSVVTQSHQDIQIILVDDGSTDKSGKLCDKWSKKDSRIKVIHKKNEGLNYARKTGFRASSGDYVTFLDSDDLLHIDNIKSSLFVAQKENLDMVVYARRDFFSNEEKSNSLSSPEDPLEYDVKNGAKEAFRFLILGGYKDVYTMTVWGKLYKRHLIESVDWKKSNVRAYEDNLFIPQVLDNTRSFAIIKQHLYFYRQKDGREVLSGLMIGNSLNNKPIGYLEYMDILKSQWSSYLKKYNLNLMSELHDIWLSNMVFRLNNLIDADLLDKENNIQFIGEVIKAMQEKHREETLNQSKQIDQLLNATKKYEAELLICQQKQDTLTKHLDYTTKHLDYIGTTRGAIKNALSAIAKKVKLPTQNNRTHK